MLSRLEALDITLWQLGPLRASSNHRLPTWIINTHAVTNVRNTGHDCFKWAFLARMHPIKTHSERLKKYESFPSKYYFSSRAYPVPLKDIETFCRRNNCSINVYGISGGNDNVNKVNIEDDEIDIDDDIEDDDIEDDQEEVDEISDDAMDIEDAKVIMEKRHVNLLLSEKNGQHHFTTIKDFSRLAISQISRRKCQHFFCYSCMHWFINKKLLKIHREQSCKTDDAQRTKMPVEDPVLWFTNVHKQLKAPFVAYADFECILKDVRDHEDKEVDTKTNITKATPDDDSKTKIYQEHVLCSFACKIASIDSNYDPEIVLYKGEDAAERLVETLQQKASEIFEQCMKYPKPMTPLTSAEERKFQQAETCHICDEHLGKDRARDHCHILGHFRGEAHNQCNLN